MYLIQLTALSANFLTLFLPLQQLMAMLENESISDIISWLPDGEAFMIHDKKIFSTEVLPMYFHRSIKYSSFTRRMNRWKFIHLPAGCKSKSAYQHPLFRKNGRETCMQMKPKPQKVSTSKVEVSQEVSYSNGQAMPLCVKSLDAVASSDGNEASETIISEYDHHQSQSKLISLHGRHQWNQFAERHHESHQINMQADRTYRDIYFSSLRDVYADHQAQLAKQMELSRQVISHLTMSSRIWHP